MFKFSHPTLIINAASGSTSDMSAEFKTLMHDKMGVEASCHYIMPEALIGTLETALTAGADLIITYGGDGTSLAAISHATAKGVPVIPLPGGTMNMLPKALYGSDIWQDVLELALAQDAPRWIPSGDINGHSFMVAAMIGAVVRLGVMREMVREGDILEATVNAAQTLRNIIPEDGLTYWCHTEDKKYNADMLQITCPNMTPFSTQEDAFEVVGIMLESYAELTTLGVTALLQDWRKDESVHVNFSDKVTVQEPVGDTKTMDVLLDGEHIEMALPLNLKLNVKGALCLCP